MLGTNTVTVQTSVLFFCWPKQSQTLSNSRGWKNGFQFLMGNMIKSQCRRSYRMGVIVKAIFENNSLTQSVGKFSGIMLDVHLSKMYNIYIEESKVWMWKQIYFRPTNQLKQCIDQYFIKRICTIRFWSVVYLMAMKWWAPGTMVDSVLWFTMQWVITNSTAAPFVVSNVVVAWAWYSLCEWSGI